MRGRETGRVNIEAGNPKGRDADLIRRFQEGDRHALETLIKAHHLNAIGYVKRRVRNTADAEDIVADVESRFAAALMRFDGRAAFATWLYHVLDNAIIDAGRRVRSRPTPAPQISPDSFPSRPAGSDYEQERKLDAKRLGKGIVDAVSKLPEIERRVLVMYEIEGLSIKEIARLLGGMNENTVKTHARRARERLRVSLAEYRTEGSSTVEEVE